MFYRAEKGSMDVSFLFLVNLKHQSKPSTKCRSHSFSLVEGRLTQFLIGRYLHTFSWVRLSMNCKRKREAEGRINRPFYGCGEKPIRCVNDVALETQMSQLNSKAWLSFQYSSLFTQLKEEAALFRLSIKHISFPQLVLMKERTDWLHCLLFIFWRGRDFRQSGHGWHAVWQPCLLSGISELIITYHWLNGPQHWRIDDPTFAPHHCRVISRPLCILSCWPKSHWVRCETFHSGTFITTRKGKGHKFERTALLLQCTLRLVICTTVLLLEKRFSVWPIQNRARHRKKMSWPLPFPANINNFLLSRWLLNVKFIMFCAFSLRRPRRFFWRIMKPFSWQVPTLQHHVC